MVVTVDGVDYPLWQTDALVVGVVQQDYVRQLNLNAASKMCCRYRRVIYGDVGMFWFR